MINDIISDMLTRIRNANILKHKNVLVIYSKVNLAILKILLEYGYILNYKLKQIKKNIFYIKISLKYTGWWLKKSNFFILKKISKSGKRLFSTYKKFYYYLPILKKNKGIAIISTSFGIISHYKAINLKQGGEIICYIE